MMGSHWIKVVTAVAAVAVAGNTAFGQWIDRAYSLNSGWNAVYLEVDPDLPPSMIPQPMLFGHAPV